MRLIEKESIVKTDKFKCESILIFRSNSNFHGYIEYTATSNMSNGKVYRVDKAIYKQNGNHTSYTPKN